jgi:hypothetical protein
LLYGGSNLTYASGVGHNVPGIQKIVDKGLGQFLNEIKAMKEESQKKGD